MNPTFPKNFKPQGPCEILLVEDNARDIRLVNEALTELALPCVLRIARDGREALRMLRQEGEHHETPLPHIVLLDINLPILSGIEVLQQIKSDPKLCVIPVLILTTSGAERDVLTCYTLHANSYLVKPSDFDEFSAMLGSIHEFWVGRSVSPLASRNKAVMP